MINTVFYASRNRGKIKEVTRILSDLDIELKTVEDFPGYPEVEENGATFFENALLKGMAGFSFSGIPSLGEDAGLEVRALNNEPGVYSARYRPDLTQDEKNRDIIRRLDEIGAGDRSARFHSVFVLVYGHVNAPKLITAEGLCHGIVAEVPKGEDGFGYDPIFLVPETGKTFGELGLDIKNRISHRSNGLAVLKERLKIMQENAA